ncbi:MAG: hypothetical protein V1909_06840 [Candidatus Micrarchaeota archaeon]
MKKEEKKIAKETVEKEPNKAPVVKVPLLRSIWEDEGRRVLFILLLFSFICMIAAVFVNLFYKPTYKLGQFGGFDAMKSNYERTIIPVGFLLALVSLLFFSLSGTYGHYTEVTFRKKSILAKSFFRKMSFYTAMLGAIFLLSGGIVNSIAERF